MAQLRNLQPLFGLPRAFPIRLTVAEGESLQSYVHRLAARHDVPLGVTLSDLGLVTEIRQKPMPGFGIVMTDEQVRNFSFVAGTDEEQTRSLLLSKFSGSALDLNDATPTLPDTVRKAAVREWAYFSGSHYCPECLKESGGVWQIAWKLPWSFACTKHEAILHDHCPECWGRAESGNGDGSVSPGFIAKVPKPGFCGNVLSPGVAKLGKGSMPCGCNLMMVHARRPIGITELIDTQRFIDQHLTSPELINSGRSKVFFDEMRSVCALILYRAELEDFPAVPDPIREMVALHIAKRNSAQDERTESGTGRNGARPRMYIGAPKSAMTMAAVAHLALSIVQKTEPDALRASLQVLGERTCARSSKYRYEVLNYFGLSERLREALTDAISARGSFDRRAGHLSTVQMRVDGRKNKSGPKYEPKHVPQCMPVPVYDAKFKEFFPNVHDSFARRFCSLAAVKSLGHTWVQSAKLLSLPTSMYGMANRCVMLLNRQGNFDQFALELYKWTKDIASENTRIDYEELRDIYRDFTDFSDERWSLICADAGVSKGNIGSRSKYAATWLWSEMTCGDWALAPALAAHSMGNHQHDVYKSFVKTLLPTLAPALTRESKRMMTEFRQNQKKLSSSSSSSS